MVKSIVIGVKSSSYQTKVSVFSSYTFSSGRVLRLGRLAFVVTSGFCGRCNSGDGTPSCLFNGELDLSRK